MKIIYCVICGKYRKSKNLFFKNFICIIFCKCENEDGKIMKNENLIEKLKYLGLIKNI